VLHAMGNLNKSQSAIVTNFVLHPRHQHRSCSLCSKPVENTNNLLDSYRKIQELLTNKDELVQHLCSNVVYEDGNVQATMILIGRQL
jgi:hypothetical protein